MTREGESLLRAVEATFAQLATACEAVREHARGTRPMLAISASGSVASLWLAPRLAAFAALHPSVQWQLRSIEDEEPDMVREGLDLAVLRVRRGMMAAGDRLLFSETVFPVCSPSLRLLSSPDELSRDTLLQEDHVASPEKDWSTWLELLGCGARAKVTIVRFYTFSAALAAAVAGAGIALGRTPLIDFELSGGRLTRRSPIRRCPARRILLSAADRTRRATFTWSILQVLAAASGRMLSLTVTRCQTRCRASLPAANLETAHGVGTRQRLACA